MRAASCVLALALAACGGGRESYQPVATSAPATGSGSEATEVSHDEPPPDHPSDPEADDPAVAEPSPDAPPPVEEPPAEEPPAEPPREPVLARVSAQDVTVDGRRPPRSFAEMIESSIGAPLEQVLACYTARLEDDRALQGDLRLRLWVSARRVIRATVEQPLDDAALQVCAITRIRTLELPPDAPRAGAAVRFLIRFALGPRTIEPPPGVLVSEARATVP